MSTRSILTNQLFLALEGPLTVRDQDVSGLRADAELLAPYFQDRLVANKSTLHGPALRPFHIAADKWSAIKEALH